MSNNFPYNKDKAIAATVFILREMDGTIGLHKLSKILYFADQKHLVEYGRPITGDTYEAMNFGPVPHTIYNLVKHGIPTLFSKHGGHNLLLEEYDEAIFEELSETDLDFLSESINENKGLTFKQLVDKSHKDAWTKNEGQFIDIMDIAKEAGADENMLNYIAQNIANQNFAA